MTMPLHVQVKMTPRFQAVMTELSVCYERYLRNVVDLSEYEKAPFASFDMNAWSRLNDAYFVRLKEILAEAHTLSFHSAVK
jgi:hypothetical protein